MPTETTAFRARECHLSGEWIVETEMMCLNGLAAWVSVANCGKPEASDEMTGYDPAEWARRIASALEIEKNLRAELELYREGFHYDVTMGGAIYTGTLNRSALDRARRATEARIAKESAENG